MFEPALKKSLLAFLAVVITGSAMPARAHQISATPLRTLSAAERSEANEASDRADRMRSELEKRLPRAPIPANLGRPEPLELGELDEKATEVVRAYKEVIERYSHTEIAAYSATRLAGFYQRLRRFDDAGKILEGVAHEYAGTAVAHEANVEAGLFHLQGRHDPREAIQWFAKVPEPANPSDAEALGLYLSAQQLSLKCELVLGRDNQAKERLEGLKAALPQYASELEKFYQFEYGARESRPAPESDGGTKTPATDRGKSVTSVADDDVDRRALEDLVRRLGRVRAGTETEKAVAELARHGGAAVEEIERQIADGPTVFGMVHRSVRVLEKVNSEISRVLLKKIAMGQFDNVATSENRGWAARALINCDPNQARELLSTSDRGVLETAINGLRGKGMDQALFDALKPHIESEDPWIRQRTASIMASESPPGELADQALECIVKVLVAVEEIPDVDQMDPSSRRGGFQTTVGETHYHACAGMLFHVNADNAALHETAKQLQGRARDAVVLALAYRHDKSVYDDIVKLAEDPDAGMFRAWAARALTDIGTMGDLPLLRKLSETDPLKRSGGGLGARSNFPVRESAENSIRTFELRAKK